MNLLRIVRNTLQPARAAEPNETCPACGQQFACSASLRGCWCTEIKLSEETRARLRERYTSCLCRDCLQRYSSSSIPPPGANP